MCGLNRGHARADIQRLPSGGGGSGYYRFPLRMGRGRDGVSLCRDRALVRAHECRVVQRLEVDLQDVRFGDPTARCWMGRVYNSCVAA